jgi:hypothetical protein
MKGGVEALNIEHSLFGFLSIHSKVCKTYKGKVPSLFRVHFSVSKDKAPKEFPLK